MQQKIIRLFENTPVYTQSALCAFLNRPQPTEAEVRGFLRWQKHFYHFVRVFSKMLARCAAEIEDTRHRLHLIDNLMCEHGLPEGRAHVDTYRDYLQCLAAHLGQQPFAEADFAPGRDAAVQAVVADFERMPAAWPGQLLFLGGIEYVYALISRDVAAFLQRIDPVLAQGQAHYTLHAELDWEHGWEFVDTYLMLARDGGMAADEAHIGEQLLHGARHLVAQIERLMALEDVAAKPLGFYHSREDVAVEEAVLRRYFPQAARLDVLAVCGGGENHITLANRLPETQFYFDLVDINPQQLVLARAKFAGTVPPFYPPEHTAKFEHLFAELRRYADVRHGCNTVFHRDNLIAYFGEQAVLGCREAQTRPLVFAEHFYRAFCSRPQHWNTENILHGRPIRAVPAHSNLHACSFVEWDMAAGEPAWAHRRYDVMLLSNVPDWMAEERIAPLLSQLAGLSRAGTVLLVRRLLSDYDMAAAAAAGGWRIAADSDRQPELFDATGFYRQIFVLVRA